MGDTQCAPKVQRDDMLAVVAWAWHSKTGEWALNCFKDQRPLRSVVSVVCVSQVPLQRWSVCTRSGSETELPCEHPFCSLGVPAERRCRAKL
jgi:hypothetical protein